jgi:hypothetical protein
MAHSVSVVVPVLRPDLESGWKMGSSGESVRAMLCCEMLVNQAGTLAVASSFRPCPTPAGPALKATPKPAASV